MESADEFPAAGITPLCSEDHWLAALESISSWHPPNIPTVVLAPHPDDETLSAGGLIAMQRRRGVPVTVVAVTNGELACGDRDLGARRRDEQEAALRELGVASSEIVRLNLPDGRVKLSETVLEDFVRPLIEPPVLLLASWSLDPHPDHQACGRVAERLARSSGVTLASYLFWTWHRTAVASLMSYPLHRLELELKDRTARAAALAQYKSQVQGPSGVPILSSTLLAPAQRPFETFIIGN